MMITPIDGMGQLAPAARSQPSTPPPERKSGEAKTALDTTKALFTPFGQDRVQVSVEAASQKAQEAPQEESDAVARNREDKMARLQESVAEAQKRSTSVQFEIDQKHDGQVIVKVINRESGEVVRQLPPEEMLNLAAKMAEFRGLLVSETS